MRSQSLQCSALGSAKDLLEATSRNWKEAQKSTGGMSSYATFDIADRWKSARMEFRTERLPLALNGNGRVAEVL